MSAIQQELPLAIVEGKAMTDIPQDLYIPPDALSVILDAFEGPLDLLLYLIRRQNMDILTVDVSEITRQYIEYIQVAKTMKFELAAEYLLMAAMLAEIKSRMLLPKINQDDEDEDDPRAELIRRLQQYERFKKAAEDLDELPRVNREISPIKVEADIPPHNQQHPDVSLNQLLNALNSVLQRSDMFVSHHIEKEKLSTRERMSLILEKLNGESFVTFYSLFTPEEGRDGVVVTFLAVMELIKEQLLDFVQAETLGPIHVKARVN
jgi:segregation and condensation protein A